MPVVLVRDGYDITFFKINKQDGLFYTNLFLFVYDNLSLFLYRVSIMTGRIR